MRKLVVILLVQVPCNSYWANDITQKAILTKSSLKSSLKSFFKSLVSRLSCRSHPSSELFEYTSSLSYVSHHFTCGVHCVYKTSGV